MIKIEKQNINLLIDTLINSGGGQNIYGKMSEILQLLAKSNDIRILRKTLLLWLDNMSIFNVNFQFQPPTYAINKPLWVNSPIEGQYNLLGALTLNEIDLLESNKVKHKENNVTFQQLEIELPDTYYTNDINSVENLGFKISHNPLFINIRNDEDKNQVLLKLTKGTIYEDSSHKGLGKVSFIKDDTNATVYIENQDDVRMFDWISRNYYKCNFKEQLQDQEGLKLIQVVKKYSERHTESFTLLLSRTLNEEWNYQYFDPEKIDERWARFIYLSKLSHYDLHKGVANEKLVSLLGNLKGLRKVDILTLGDLNSKNVLEIPNEMLKQFIQYDKRKGILAIPVTIPLPKVFMKYLFSCSGRMPIVFTNKFSRNPNYILKVLYSGRLSENGTDISYPDETYFMKENMYLFTCVPPELADEISSKLDLPYYKRTFFENVNL